MAKHTRQRDEWGSITFEYRGRRDAHRIRYWAKDPKTGEMRRMSEVVRGSRKDARERRAQLRVEHSADAPRPTVGEVWEQIVLPGYEQRVANGTMAPNTLGFYRGNWKNHIAPRWADVPVDAVRPLEVQQWLTQCPQALKSANTLLSAIMERAVAFEMVESNPMDVKYVVPDVVERKERVRLTSAQLRDVWCSCAGEWPEAAILLMAFGSCRLGESLGVLAEECEYVDGVFLAPVKRQVPPTGSRVTDRLKNRFSYRTVAVPGKAAKRLWQLCQQVGHGPLTHDGAGGWSQQQRLKRYVLGHEWPEGIPHFSCRDLRPSWQTMARWEWGLPPWLTERMMGHVGEGVTGQHYDRPEAEEFRIAVSEAYASKPFDADWQLTFME